jgi:hypothetical protein
MPKRPSLTAYATRKAEAPPEALVGPAEPAAPDAETGGGGQRTGQTLRLRKEAWRQLRQLTLELEVQRNARVHQNDLLIEAFNDLFRKYNRPPLA